MRIRPLSLVCALLMTAVVTVYAAAEEPASCDTLLKQKDEALQTLARDNAMLQDKLKALESTPGISSEALALKNYQRLQEIARDTRAQRQVMADSEVYVKWMTANLAAYSKYVEAGSVAAGFAKVLPIPYAGQAGMFTKFVSHFALSLSAASVSINRYLATSQQFVTRVEAIGPPESAKSGQISELARFADEQLLKEMNDVQLKLTTTAELSTSALSFLESLNHYIGSTDEYWNKTKSLLKRSEVDKKEKSFISESIQGLRNKAGNFNARLKQFDDVARKDAPLIKSLGAYDELVREMASRKVQISKQ